MSERDSYEPGTPSWVDLSTTDPAAAKRFYGELFGWDAVDAGPPEETGGYGFFNFNGKMVAGVGPVMGEGQPPAWSTYVNTDDVDAMAERAAAAGGQVIAGPMDVMDAGRMAMFMHPAAGVIGAWQPGRHRGAQWVNDPGGWNWCELLTRDVEGAKAFCEPVFGWTASEADFGGMTYTVWHLGESGIGGMAQMPSDVPEGVPNFWMDYFAVEDCDASVARAQELGGTLTMGPMSVEGVGRFAVAPDPQGAQFGIIQVMTG
jgi:predicted enzyme related to lactoylglutathione lyase